MIELYLPVILPMASAERIRNRINQIENVEFMNYTMKPILLAILGGAALLLLFSCSEKKNEDITQSVNKNGSVETAVQVEHLDSLQDILITTHKIWAKDQVVKSVIYRDTLPSLGVEYTTAENADGEQKNIRVKKEYEIFITVK